MTTWTETARTELERYFTRIRPTLETSGADADEVIEDLRRHLDSEIASAQLSIVTEQDVQRLLARIGAPEASSPPPSKSVPPESHTQSAVASARPGKIISGLLLFAGVILPLITLALELATNMCAAAFFDPLPTILNVLLVAFVPVANLLAWVAVTNDQPERRAWLGWVNGIAIGVAVYYAFLFLPLMLPGLLAVIFFGWGLLPWSPMLSLIAAVGLRRYIRQLGAAPEAPMTGLWRGMGLGLLAVVLIAAPGITTRIGLQMAASDSAQEQRAGLSWLRYAGREDTLLRACYGFTRGAQQMDIVGSLIAGRNRVSAEKAREVYYRATGRSFNSVPAPTVRTGRGTFAELNEWTWDEDHGGDRVGGRIKGLSLLGSRLDTLVDADAVWSYTEWTLEFRNDSIQDREARAQILLPPGGVVSRLTLWVNGEEREAAFAGRSHVREAYQKIAVQQRRDPVLVTTAGPDRILMQCFPVPRNGGMMKVRLGITAPLLLRSVSEGLVRLPSLVERNFSLPDGFEHAVWVGGGCEIKAPGAGLSAEAAKPGHSALRGTLANVALSSPQSLLAVARESDRRSAWTKDTRAGTEQFIRQTLALVPSPRPARVVFVIDGSRPMNPHLAAIAEAIKAAAAKIESTVLVASDEVVELGYARQNAAEALRRFKAQGGQDNAPALLRAWNLAAEKPGSVILWIHAPQPVLLTSPAALIQALERAGEGSPRLFELQTDSGPDRLLEKLDGFVAVHSLLRTDGLAGDLKALLESWLTSRAEVKLSRTVLDSETAAREGGAAETGLHLARLWALEEVRRLRAARKYDDAVRLAARYQIVTQVSGAVVLENKQQYVQTGLQPVDPETVPAIPEPRTITLLCLGAAAGWLRLRRLRRKAVRGMNP